MNIRDILQFGGLKDARIIAGMDGIENEVTSVSVLEVADTRIKSWVLEKQLYITSFYAILQDYEMQKKVILTLKERKCAGLVICHIDLFMKEIHPDIICLCNEIAFPLIVAKSESSYVEIINPILLKLSGNMENEYFNIVDMQNKFIRNIATKKDVNDIFRTMADEYGRVIFIFDVNDNIIYPRHHQDAEQILQLVEEGVPFLREKFRKEGYCIVDTDHMKRIIFNIESNGLNFGTIVAECSEDDMDREIRMIRSFANLCTLVLTTAARIDELEAFKRQEYLSDLITWNFRSDEIAAKMGLDVGWDITNKGIMIIVNLNNIQENININTRDLNRLINEILYKKIRDIVKMDNKQNILGVRSDIFIILLENDSRDIYARAKIAGEKIIECCNENFSGSVSVGISEIIDNYRKIPNAYYEAVEAVRIGRGFWGVNQVIGMKEIGFYGILRDITDMERYKKVKNNLFEVLKRYDAEKESELFTTLRALIMNNMNVEKTAKELYLHKNTVNYRKNKITEILDYEPWNMPHLLNTLIYIASECYE